MACKMKNGIVGFLRALALGTLILVGANSSPAKAVPIFDFFTGNYRIFTGVVDLAPQTDFVARQITLGLDSGFIDFETLPYGSPTLGNTDSGRFPADQYPVRYDIGLPVALNLSSTIPQAADLALPSDASPVISQTHVSPFFALAANGAFDGTAEIIVDFDLPVSAAGIWLTGVDDFLVGADARVTWFFDDGSSLTRTSDTAGRVVNQFFGLITYDDGTKNTALNSITRMSFRQLGGNFNQGDNLLFGRLSSQAVPEPTTLTLFATGLAGLGFMLRRRRSSALSGGPA